MPRQERVALYSFADASDDELVARARVAVEPGVLYDELYRRHAPAARRVARHILGSTHDADEVTNDAFAGVISAISRGAGPRTNVRAYLMACVRNGCRARFGRSQSVSTDPASLESYTGAFEDPDTMAESGLIAEAFSSLSADWQRTLWMTEVEERPMAEIAAALDRKPEAVAALAYRARQAFAEAYLAQHQSHAHDPACRRIGPKLARYVRGKLTEDESTLVDRHLAECSLCVASVTDLRDVNASLRSLAGPAAATGLTLAVVPTAAMSTVAVGSVGGWAATGLGSILAKAAVALAVVVPAAVITVEVVDTDNGRAEQAVASPGAAEDSTATVSGPSSVDDTTPTSSSGANGDDDGDGRSVVDPAPQSTTATPPTIDAAAQTTIDGASTTVADDGATDTTQPGIGQGGLPPIDLPSVSTPTVSLPAISTPAISTPVISTPTVVLPGVSLPAISTPVITTPALSTPPIGLPGVPILPSITVPSLTVPSVTVPSITVPSITVPSVTVPSVTVPSVTIPPITLPSISLGGLLGLGG